MVHHTNTNHPDNAVERPQSYDWGELPDKRGFTARIVLPFISTKYKTDVTQNCLLRCLSEPTIPRDYEEADEDDAPSAQLLHDSPLWHAPPLEHKFSFHTFFALYHAHFRRAAPLLFHHLRKHIYEISEEQYQDQFTKPLRPIDGLGFSGSLFFFTNDGSTIIKSVGRRFEYTFLFETMIDALGEYFLANESNTLLSRITDVVYSSDHRLGGWMGISPGHYVVMQNVLEGLDGDKGCRKWDLKPQNFFEPTRDLVPDQIKTEQAKSGLADELDEDMVLTRQDKSHLMALIEKDTEFLQKVETIDYSLLLGRYPVKMFEGEDALEMSPPGEKNWVKGVKSGDGKWVYKMCILDFLWNTEQLRPKIMRTAGQLLPEQTVTTEPKRYRDEFLKMMDEYIVTPDEE